jgi:creatinine amidohydrolase
MAPKSVDMRKAVKDYHGNAPGGLTRKPGGSGVYSPSGIWGDPTLATREKGRRVTEALVTEILKEIEDLRQTPVSASTVR